MSKRLVFSILCLAACFSLGTWAAYRFMFSPAPRPELVEVVGLTEVESTDNIDDREQQPCSEDIQHVSFQGVSFDFDRCAFGDVKTDRLPDSKLERPEDKPDSVAPEHLRFEFSSGPKGREPFVEIYPVQRFPSMYAADKRAAHGIRKEIRDLKIAIKRPTFRHEGQIPYLPYIDGGQSLQTHVSTTKFYSGKGIYFLTYIEIEAIIVTNDHLRYIFEGLTYDGNYYVLAEFPVAVPFLPYESDIYEYNFEGFSQSDVDDMVRTSHVDKNPPKHAELTNRFDAYMLGVTSRLEKTKPDEFNPSLSKLQELIKSLRIKN